jgi:hypothetical protein
VFGTSHKGTACAKLLQEVNESLQCALTADNDLNEYMVGSDKPGTTVKLALLEPAAPGTTVHSRLASTPELNDEPAQGIM